MAFNYQDDAHQFLDSVARFDAAIKAAVEAAEEASDLLACNLPGSLQDFKDIAHDQRLDLFGTLPQEAERLG